MKIDHTRAVGQAGVACLPRSRSQHKSGVALVPLALALAAGVAFPAQAQQTAPADKVATADTAVPEIIVTGSLITRQDYKASSPISTLSSAAITAAGQPSLDRALGQMPQFEAAQGAAEVGDVQGSVGFGGGASYSDLRGIGRNRSLVLLDGRRMMPSTPDGAIDLNTIPMALLDSVEVITGGASATYGSDAVAGVANFKLRQTFTGVELNGNHGGSFKGDGATTQVSGIVGGNFDEGRGHAMMAFEYSKRDAVSGSQRAFFTDPAARPKGLFVPGAGARRGPRRPMPLSTRSCPDLHRRPGIMRVPLA